MPTVPIVVAKELFTLILKIIQITNLETKSHLLSGSFTETDDYTN